MRKFMRIIFWPLLKVLVLVFSFVAGSLVARLANTPLGHPAWELRTGLAAAAVGMALALVLFAISRHSTLRQEKKFFRVILSVFIVTLVLCLSVSFTIDTIPDKETVLFWRDRVWQPGYFVLCVSYVLIIVSAVGLRSR